MALFKNNKPKDKLPDLPPLSLPSPLKENEEKEKPEEKVASLPKFPSSATGEKMSRETVKSIIQKPEESEEESNIPDFRSSGFGAEEVEETGEVIPRLEKTESIKERMGERGQVFIQIDQYQEVLRELEEALDKVDKIHEVLRNVKQSKEEEENEILEWENELLRIKEDLSKIDQTIFKELK
jgi:hypothetical protein